MGIWLNPAFIPNQKTSTGLGKHHDGILQGLNALVVIGYMRRDRQYCLNAGKSVLSCSVTPGGQRREWRVSWDVNQPDPLALCLKSFDLFILAHRKLDKWLIPKMRTRCCYILAKSSCLWNYSNLERKIHNRQWFCAINMRWCEPLADAWLQMAG